MSAVNFVLFFSFNFAKPLGDFYFFFLFNRLALTQVRSDRVEIGGTLGLTATHPQTERGQRNEDGLGPFHVRILRASVMLRSGGDYIIGFLSLPI